MALGRKTGGRVKGTPNKATAELKAYAQQFTKQAIDILVRIATSGENEVAAVMAAREVLDRAVGKPAQEIVGKDGEALEIPASIKFIVTKAAGADTRK
jgi:hypothetical protein